jgi:hypothetical protein
MRDPDGHIDGLTGLVQRMSLLPRLVRPMRRSVPTNRSAKEFARGERTSVLMIRAYTYKRLRNTVSKVKSARGAVPVSSTGPFPRTASRTRRACFQAPGAPQVPRGRVVLHPVTGQGAGMAVPR